MTHSPGIIINTPNLLTLFRILITPLFVIFMIKGQYRLSLLVFTLAGLSDALDGFLARWFNQKTVLGAHLDPLADKLLLTSAYVALAIQQTIPGSLAVVVISRDILILAGIAVLRFFHIPITVKPSVISKCTTAAQLATAFLALLGLEIPRVQPALTPFFWLTLILTIISGLHYVVLGALILNRQSEDHPER